MNTEEIEPFRDQSCRMHCGQRVHNSGRFCKGDCYGLDCHGFGRFPHRCEQHSKILVKLTKEEWDQCIHCQQNITDPEDAMSGLRVCDGCAFIQNSGKVLMDFRCSCGGFVVKIDGKRNEYQCIKCTMFQVEADLVTSG